MHPLLADLIQLCARHGVGHVVLAGGLPPAPAIEAVKAFGAKLICFTPALSLGKKLLRSGVDALVIEGMEAGGHIGPVSTSVLAQEILPALADQAPVRSEEHTSELQSLMRISYAVFCLKKKTQNNHERKDKLSQY